MATPPREAQFPDRENSLERVRSVDELGALFRRERKRRGLTLANVRDATGLSLRFLSEFERGKQNASVGLVLRALSTLGLELFIAPRAGPSVRRER